MVYYIVIIKLVNFNITFSQIFKYVICFLLINYLINNIYNLSLYNQLINLLNDKINISIIIIMHMVIVGNVLKTLNKTIYNKSYILIIYLNIIMCDIYLNNGYVLTDTLLNVNVNLLNGLMLIHPVLLYFFYTIYMLVFKVKFFLKY